MYMNMKYLLLVLTVAINGISFAYNYDLDNPNYKITQSKNSKANCAPASARLTMQYNDVSALLETGGMMFMDRANNVGAYIVPKNDNVNAIFAASLWMGGKDINGQLKLAAQKFRSGNDFWTGPLSAVAGSGNYDPSKPVGDNTLRDFGDANISPDECLAFDRFYTIRKDEVLKFVSWFDCEKNKKSNCEKPTNEVLNRIYSWPAHGDISKGQDQFLAPFKDVDGNGLYEPLKGDYPWYANLTTVSDKVCGSDRRISLFGDETHWWIFNDKGNIHSESNGEPIGMEIRAQAFTFLSGSEINQMTFYNYELINKGTQTLYDTYFSQYVDADLGNFSDDYVGCDVTRGLGYVYNGKPIDTDIKGRKGYGENPPAIGVDFFEGPYQDADGLDNPGPVVNATTGKLEVPTVVEAIAKKGIVYSGLGIGYGDGIIDNERFGMKRFNYYSGGTTGPVNDNISDPTTAAQFYHYMEGKWRFGQRTSFGGNGLPGANGVTSFPADYMFPGTSDTLYWGTLGENPGSNNWSERTVVGNNPGDRRFVQSAGPFTLKPGAVNNITVGIVYAESESGGDYPSVEALKRADTKAQLLFDNCFKILEPPSAPKLDVQEITNGVILTLSNPSSSNNFREKYIQKDFSIDPFYADVYYRFEGYKIYQLKNASVDLSKLENSTDAVMIRQCDIKNNVSSIVNYNVDDELGMSLPQKMVSGLNEGIKHSFIVEKDAFTNTKLLNYKKYYFVAVAYAYNNYKNYDPSQLDGQQTPYISSRKSYDGSPIVPLEAVPHNTLAENIVVNSGYGKTPQITRLDGRGNGNRDLRLTSDSRSKILSLGKYNTPTYDYGKGPINIKVVDPLNLANGYFTCKFNDYTVANSEKNEATNNKGVDTASWTIYRYDKEGGSLLDSINSDVSIADNNEQIIPEWGISVQIEQSSYYFTNSSKNLSNTLEYLRYSNPVVKSETDDQEPTRITFSNPNKQWLSFIKDENGFSVKNWIRSGDFIPKKEECDSSLGFSNPCYYADEVDGSEKSIDPDKLYSKLLGGGIAPHCLTGYQYDYMPLAYPSFFKPYIDAREKASITRLPSIDIVFTSDTSLWTRCPVIELGRYASLNEGGALAGTLRKGASVDKNGKTIAGSTGMGWFPGYAIDIETGVRLHMAFGENSFLADDNGRDMIWNPSSVLLDENERPHLGGQHAIYVFGYNVHGYSDQSKNCPYYDGVNNWVYDKLNSTNSTYYSDAYHSLLWIANPILTNADFKVLECDVTVSVRVNKEYNDFAATGLNVGKPMYGWSMAEIVQEEASRDVKKDALSLINVVPNPYYAYSPYETLKTEARVKITNLPQVCTIKIYNTYGKLVWSFKKDSPINYVDWNLLNTKSVPVASGVYLIHVDVPNVGETVIKFFGGQRQIDLENI
jgi:hypothetical protein